MGRVERSFQLENYMLRVRRQMDSRGIDREGAAGNKQVVMSCRFYLCVPHR